jgi:MinD-like ATPase involved in chromosome partitioning or flagellar assembly
MTLVAICEAPGTSASTTTALALAALAPDGHSTLVLECDPSGGDLAGWAGLYGNPSWSSAIAAPDRSWSGLYRHLQELPSGLHVMLAPSSPSQAATVVAEAAERFAPMVSALGDVVAFADCGRSTGRNGWIEAADLVVLLVRQAASAGATVARIDRSVELGESLQRRGRVGVVVVGDRPYAADEIAATLGVPLLGVLPNDGPGAALAAGAWTVGKGANRTPLARATRRVSASILEQFDRGPLAVPADIVSSNGVHA